ncbi:c-type cytochrome biogenesis protein CcmI [Marinovum sp. 2_MG-2023]|uniref:c-type cytochrome biogenesis protein CcmI n=1 Tax=unclassified Marinovum TaxID=2647166 RepID=UPI0026E1ED80|nr:MULTISPECIES: c-type cytochrome biogenesis protein CcmI [unclassified Marinovum]MDO6729376.1 c-type cytochrome biogenesis protein CcmI [Marinovum sp. 2_MG-2023]MDO6780408.1 c-type cytochrome biogenesis protein CcmI [Marinovum sp. 1_MG-2023]
MNFWIPAGLMAILAGLIILLPLWRRGTAQVGHREGALAIFVDQLKEVDAERARGVISPQEAEAAALEIKRRMLAVERQGGDGGKIRTGGTAALFVMAVMVPLLAGGVYLATGAPGISSQPFADRAAERGEDQKIVELTERLKARLQADESGGPIEGWELLAQTYMQMGRYQDAVAALAEILDRPDTRAGHVTQYAEALIAAADGIVTQSAAAAIDRALDMDVLNPAAIFYKAQWLEQDGQVTEARALLVLRLSQEETAQPWMEYFIREINRISATTGDAAVAMSDFVTVRGPSADDVAAAAEMTADDRADFIQSMVAGLAERLQETPEDLDGWLQLGRAYGVLGQSDKALEAYRAAEGLLSTLAAEDPRHAIVAQGLAANGG